jgi:mxaD protein
MQINGLFKSKNARDRSSENRTAPVGRAAVFSSIVVASIVFADSAHSAGVLLREKQIVKIAAAPEKVWKAVSEFSDLTWVPAVKSSTATNGNKVGSVRTLDFGGATMTESLVKYSAAERSYEYKVPSTEANRKVAPLTDLDSVVTVKPAPDGTSLVTWEGTFRRAAHSEKPRAGADDATAKKTVSGTFASGLANLKAKTEGK